MLLLFPPFSILSLVCFMFYKHNFSSISEIYSPAQRQAGTNKSKNIVEISSSEKSEKIERKKKLNHLIWKQKKKNERRRGRRKRKERKEGI